MKKCDKFLVNVNYKKKHKNNQNTMNNQATHKTINVWCVFKRPQKYSNLRF